MHKELRRQDRKTDFAETIELLKSCEYGVLSTVCEDGYAYGIPLCYVYMDNNIYFHCAIKGHKLDNIRNNNKVSFCIVGDTNPMPSKFTLKYKSVIVFGKAVEVYDTEKYKGLLAILDKYAVQHTAEGIKYIKNAIDKTRVIKICIKHMTGKARK